MSGILFCIFASCQPLSISWWLLNTFSSIRFKFEFDLVCSSSACTTRISIWSLQVSSTCKKILKIKIPFQILFYPFGCMFKIMKGYKIFDSTPSGKSLKKTLPRSMLSDPLGQKHDNTFLFCKDIMNWVRHCLEKRNKTTIFYLRVQNAWSIASKTKLFQWFPATSHYIIFTGRNANQQDLEIVFLLCVLIYECLQTKCDHLPQLTLNHLPECDL